MPLDKTSTALWRKNEEKSKRNGVRKTAYWPKRRKISWEQRLVEEVMNPLKTRLNKWEPGNRYFGEWEDNKKHGFGTQTWSNGNKYEGEWVNGKRQGKGTFWKYDEQFDQNDHLRKIYTGEWHGSKKHGFGIQYLKDGSIYEGMFRQNLRHGEGAMSYANGDVYIGNWVNDEKSGAGKLIAANGNIYTGTWLQDKKEGRGEYYYADKNQVYVGEWVEGMAKCGIFAELDEQKTLPKLGVKNVKTVLKQSILKIRQNRQKERSKRLGYPDVVFTQEELDRLQKKFQEHLAIGSTTITISAIIDILESENIPYNEQSMDKLRNKTFDYLHLLCLASASRNED